MIAAEHIARETRAAVRDVREISLMRSAQLYVADLQPLLQLVTKREINVVPRLTVKQAAAYIPCGVGTLNKLRVIGGGPRYTKPAGRVLYDTRDLDQWIEASARSSTSDSGPTPRKKAA
jgi:hypothetical protein